MTVIKGIIREVGKSVTQRVSAQRWYGYTQIIVQDEATKKTYEVRLTANLLKKSHFLPRVGMEVALHGYVEEAEYGLSDYVVTRVTSIKHVGAGIKKVIKFNDLDD